MCDGGARVCARAWGGSVHAGRAGECVCVRVGVSAWLVLSETHTYTHTHTHTHTHSHSHSHSHAQPADSSELEDAPHSKMLEVPGDARVSSIWKILPPSS